MPEDRETSQFDPGWDRTQTIAVGGLPINWLTTISYISCQFIPPEEGQFIEARLGRAGFHEHLPTKIAGTN